MTYSRQYGSAIYGDATHNRSQYAGAGCYWDLQFYDTLIGSWISIKKDVCEQVTGQHGFIGNGPTDRIATTGSLVFLLNNAHNNTGGVEGYYSPGGPNCRPGFDLGSLFRLMISDGTTVKYQIRSKAKSITPIAGTHRNHKVDVVCADFFDDLANAPLQQIPVQLNTYINLAIQTAIGYLEVPPCNTSGIAAPNGPETYTRLLYGLSDKNSVLTALQRLCLTDKSYLFLIGDANHGETLKWQSRQDRNITTVSASFIGTMCDMNVLRDSMLLMNDITTVAHPTALDSAAVILAKTDAREFSIPAGGSVETTLRFTDPLQLGRGVDMVFGSQPVGWPVSGTDFKMSSVAGDNANNLAANFSVACVWGANSIKCTFSNSSGGTGYVSLFHVLGIGLYDYTPVEKNNKDTAANLQLYGVKSLRYDMPYCDNETQANTFGAAILLDTCKPVPHVKSVTFNAHDPNFPLFAGYATNLEIGQCVFVAETVSGVSGYDYIQNMKWECEQGNSVRCTIGELEPASLFTPFRLMPDEESDPPGDPAWSIMMRYKEGDPSFTPTDPYGNPFHVMFP